MSGNNEVDIVVKSKDESGPGMESARKNASKMGDTVKEVGKRAAEFAAAHFIEAGAEKVKEFVSGSVEAFSNLNESLNAVNKIFGTSANKILDWGKTTANSYGLSQRAFNDLAVPLGAGLKNAGIPMDKVADQTINLTKRASDMASVFNTSVPEALDAIQSGLRGESDPLERYGVGLTAAKVQAEALNETHKKSAKGLTTQELAMARINLIMKQTSSTQGDFVNTSGQLANAERIASAKTEELQAKIGAQLQPAVLALTKAKLALVAVLANKLLPALVAFGKWMSDHTTVVKVVAAMIAGVLVAAFVSWAVAAAAAGIATLVAMAPLLLIGAAIGVAALAFAHGWQSSQKFREAVTTSLSLVADAVLTYVNVILRIMKVLVDTWLDAGSIIINAAAKAFGWVPGIGDKLKGAAKAFDTFKNGVSDVMDKAIQKTSDWRSAVNKMPKEVKLKGQITDLNAKINAAKAKLATVPPSHQSAIRAQISQLQSQVAAAKRQLASLQGKTVHVTMSYSAVYKNFGQPLGVPYKASGGIVGAASGGMRGGLTWVGEHGAELADLPYGTKVYPSGQSKAMAGGPGGGGALTIEWVGSSAGDEFMTWLRKNIRIQGGNVQAVLGR